MSPRTHRNADGQLGLAALETALILPLFVFMLFAGVEMGRMLWIRNVITDAAAEGARLAILNEPTDAEVVNAVEAMLDRQGVTGGHAVTVSAREPGQPVTVRVEADVRFLVLPITLGDAPGQPHLAAEAVMTHTP